MEMIFFHENMVTKEIREIKQYWGTDVDNIKHFLILGEQGTWQFYIRGTPREQVASSPSTSEPYCLPRPLSQFTCFQNFREFMVHAYIFP